MGQFSELWSYCKEAFNVVKERPFLFLPPVIFMGLLIVVLLVALGPAFAGFVIGRNVRFFSAAVLFVIPMAFVAFAIVTAGQQNLYRKAALGHYVNMGDFLDGIKWFTGRIVLGILLFMVIFIGTALVAVLFLPVPGLRVLGIIAAAVLGFVIKVFLSAWTAAMAFKDMGVTDAFRDSYRFVKEFFWPMVLLTFIKGFFDGSGNNGSDAGRNSGSNIRINLPGINFRVFGGQNIRADLAVLIPFMIAMAIISIVITVYLEQLVFVVYGRREGII